MNGRMVKTFLVDRSPGGLITTEMIDWTGRFIFAPRVLLADLALRDV